MTSEEKHQAWLAEHGDEAIITKRVDAGYLPQDVGAELDKLAHNDGVPIDFRADLTRDNTVGRWHLNVYAVVPVE